MTTNYPIQLNIRIDWSEMDLFGHINNLAFLKYIQAARVSYWEHIDLYEYFHKHNIGPVLASVTCQYKKPLHYPGSVIASCGLRFIKNSSFGLHHRIIDDKGAVAAEAEDAMVLYDFNKNEKAHFPDWMRIAMEKLENRNNENGNN